MTVSAIDPLLAINRLVTDLAQRAVKIGELRSDTRYSLNEPVSLWVCRPRESPRLIVNAWGLDLSYQGLGLIVNKPLSPGAVLHACLREKKPDQLMVTYLPVFCRALVPGVHRLGGKFHFPGH